MTATIYHTGHKTSKVICMAMAKGTGFEIKQHESELLDDNAAIFYGLARGNLKLKKRCEAAGRDYYLVDNGYMRPGQWDGYYRITKNAFQHSGFGEPAWDRFERLNIDIQPWRRDGEYILIFVPPPIYGKYWDMDSEAWVRLVKSKMRKKTKRPIKLSFKPGLDRRTDPSMGTLDQQLAGAHAIVAHDSNVAIDALIAGVPVFVTGGTPAQRCGHTDLSEIDRPLYPNDRHELLAVLAGQQWTLDEFREGLAWKMIS